MDLKQVKTGPPRQRRKRVGRGESSGVGKTSGRGHKGYGARAGNSRRYSYEGGQMPLYRRLPKRGFNNIFKKQFACVNVSQLNRYADGEELDAERLKADGLIEIRKHGLKVLGSGDLKKKLTIRAQAFTRSAT
ncbi:MAG: 50S ribosomal protein L15 [Planctomycetota bacterium]|nr:50S ribosomal protein L15 [Planctomycetota bacterium]